MSHYCREGLCLLSLCRSSLRKEPGTASMKAPLLHTFWCCPSWNPLSLSDPRTGKGPGTEPLGLGVRSDKGPSLSPSAGTRYLHIASLFECHHLGVCYNQEIHFLESRLSNGSWESVRSWESKQEHCGELQSTKAVEHPHASSDNLGKTM